MVSGRKSLAHATGRLVVRHPLTLGLLIAMVIVLSLWQRAGRHYDSVEWMTPKFFLTAYSEMRVLMITLVVHDDSSWDVFHNHDIATVSAPLLPRMWPRAWMGSGEAGLIIAIGHLFMVLFLLAIASYALETVWLKRRLRRP